MELNSLTYAISHFCSYMCAFRYNKKSGSTVKSWDVGFEWAYSRRALYPGFIAKGVQMYRPVL